MAVTITQITAPQNPDVTERQVLVDGTLVLSGNYGTASSHGDILNLQQLGDLLKSSQLPTKVEVWEDPPAGTAPTFYQFVYCPSTLQTNGVLSIGANLAEYIEGTPYSAALLAAVLRIRAWFPCY